MQLRYNIKREQENRVVVENYQNDKCILQFHSQIEIYLVDQGEMEMRVNGKCRMLKAGELSVALSYDSHSYRTPERSRSSLLQIPVNLCEDFASFVQGKRLVSPYITDRQVYEKIKLYHEALKSKDLNRLQQLGYIYVILGIIVENAAFETADKPVNYDLATKILFYINDHFGEGITPGSIAHHFGYNQSYISRYFKSCCGIPLVRYLTAVRLKNAIMLIHEGKHDISYCAAVSGFSSMRTFYRAFHEEFSCSPRAYLQETATKKDLLF